jgi:hypothetical protein
LPPAKYVFTDALVAFFPFHMSGTLAKLKVE